MATKTKGAALLEYGLLVGLVSVVAIGAVASNGEKVSEIFGTVAYETSQAMASESSSSPPGGSSSSPPPLPMDACNNERSISVDGTSYAITPIGDQCWMAESLNVAAAGGMCYDNDPANCETYGRLYPIGSGASLDAYCPSGWRIPRDADWMVLEAALGMPEEDLANSGWRSRGGVEEQLSADVSEGTNSTGFSALMGGYAFGSTFSRIGEGVIFMSAESHRWRYLRTDQEGVNRRDHTTEPRYSVYARCLSAPEA